jgi:YHS domain-containing protein
VNAEERIPKTEPQLILGGYCAVSLMEDRKLVMGRAEHSIVHQGRTYRFGSLATSERFRRDPARYRPFGGGTCPVTQVEEGITKAGEARWGALYAGRLFVFTSDQNRRLFRLFVFTSDQNRRLVLDNPDQYAAVELEVHESVAAASPKELKRSR